MRGRAESRGDFYQESQLLSTGKGRSVVHDAIWSKSTSQVVRWLYRDFESAEAWKNAGCEVYLKAAGSDQAADGEAARRELARMIREHVRSLDRHPIAVWRWHTEAKEPVKEMVQPPDPHCEAQWEKIADYVLLAASCEWATWNNEISRRKDENAKLTRAFNGRRKKNPVEPPPPLLPLVELYKPVDY